MRRNISDLWGRENQWEKINARKQSQGQYWADFNCDLAPAAVSHMMNDRSPSPLLTESLIWQLSVCPLAFIVASSLYLGSHSGLLTHLPRCYSPSSQHFIRTVQLWLRLNCEEMCFSPLSVLCCRWFFSSLVWINKNRFGLLLSDSFHFCLVCARKRISANQSGGVGATRRWQVEL